MEKKTYKEWKSLVPIEWNLLILSPDGWNRNDFTHSYFNELITKEEFMKRVSLSTIRCNPKSFEKEWK